MKTEVKSKQLKDGEVKRSDINVAQSGEAMIRKLVAGTSISISSTGADSGTGDVTLNLTSVPDSLISSAATWNAKQAALSGTGFVKISGTTISYDNSTYSIATHNHSGTYEPANGNIQAHIATTSGNPHGTTSSMVGALASGAKAVDSSLLDGFALSENCTPNTVVKRTSNNYIYAGYFNSNRGDENTAVAASYIFDSGDNWMRKKSLASVKTEIVTSAAVISGLGYTPYNNTNPSGFITSTGTSAACSGNANSASLLYNHGNWNGGDGNYRIAWWDNVGSGGGNQNMYHTDTLYYQPASGILHAATFAGAGSSLTGTASSLTAGAISGQANSATISCSPSNNANQIVQRDSYGDFTGRYINASYFNSSDDISSGTLSYLIGKFGDNYHRSATAAKVQAFLGLGTAAYTANSAYATSGHTHSQLHTQGTDVGTDADIFTIGGSFESKIAFVSTQGGNNTVTSFNFVDQGGPTANIAYYMPALSGTLALTNDPRFTDARPASDVYAWAKASVKPSYNASEISLGNVTNESKATMFTNPAFTGNATLTGSAPTFYINATSGGYAISGFRNNGTLKGLTGVALLANQVVTGSAVNDFVVRSSQKILFTANDGASVNASISASEFVINSTNIKVGAATGLTQTFMMWNAEDGYTEVLIFTKGILTGSYQL